MRILCKMQAPGQCAVITHNRERARVRGRCHIQTPSQCAVVIHNPEGRGSLRLIYDPNPRQTHGRNNFFCHPHNNLTSTPSRFNHSQKCAIYINTKSYFYYAMFYFHLTSVSDFFGRLHSRLKTARRLAFNLENAI